MWGSDLAQSLPCAASYLETAAPFYLLSEFTHVSSYQHSELVSHLQKWSGTDRYISGVLPKYTPSVHSKREGLRFL